MTRSKRPEETSKRWYSIFATEHASIPADKGFRRAERPMQLKISYFSEVICLPTSMFENVGPENNVARRNTVRLTNRKMYDASKTKLVTRSACMCRCYLVRVGLKRENKGGVGKGLGDLKLLYGPFLRSSFDANLTTPSTSCPKGPQLLTVVAVCC